MPPCLSNGGDNESLAPTAGNANISGQVVFIEVLEASKCKTSTNDTLPLANVFNPLPLYDPTNINNVAGLFPWLAGETR
eukprot:6488405-Lingulodinium_polyedra.AAC.1